MKISSCVWTGEFYSKTHLVWNLNNSFLLQGRAAITVEVTSAFDKIDKFLIHAHKLLNVDFNNFVVTDDTGYVEQVTDIWESFPYVDEKGVLRTNDDSDEE